MTNETSETTVAEFVATSPSAAEALDEAGIDYCCGGDAPLAAACARAGVDMGALQSRIEQLDAAGTKRNDAPVWEQRSLRELAAHIVTQHHAYTRAAVGAIFELLPKVVSAHGEKYPELSRIQQIFGHLERELARHMNQEEMLLFPAIARTEQAARGEGASISAGVEGMRYPIHQLIEDHDEAGAMLREIRRESHNYRQPEHGCASLHRLYEKLQALERDLHWHVHLENNILFPRAEALERALQGTRS